VIPTPATIHAGPTRWKAARPMTGPMTREALAVPVDDRVLNLLEGDVACALSFPRPREHPRVVRDSFAGLFREDAGEGGPGGRRASSRSTNVALAPFNRSGADTSEAR